MIGGAKLRRVLLGLAHAAGVPLLGVGLMVAGTLVAAFGTPVVGRLGGIVSGLLTFAGVGTMLFGMLRYENLFVAFGTFFPLGLGLAMIDFAVEDQLVLTRGEVTTCTVLDVTRHEQSGEGDTRIWHVFDLSCAQPAVTKMSTGGRIAEPGDSIAVRYYPGGGLDTRPADSDPNPRPRALLGAAALGVGIVVRMLAEFGVLPADDSRLFSRRPRAWRKELRRQKLLGRARAKGDSQARPAWLLSYLDAPVRGRPPVATATHYPGHGRTPSEWAVSLVSGSRCRVSLRAAPPAMADQFQALCDVYLISDEQWDAENVVTAGESARVAADHGDLQRWREATQAYLDELEAVNDDLWHYWVDRARRLGLRWGRSTLLQDWQRRVRSGHARLVLAADAYRPVFEEIRSTIATTAQAQQELEARHRRLSEWASRRLWYLTPASDGGQIIVRSDVSGDAPPGTVLRDLSEVYEDAQNHRHTHLVPVGWDEASLRACDAELAELSAAYPPVGTTRSGRPMLNPSPVTFADWFQWRHRQSHDWISDPEELARARAIKQLRFRRTVRPRSAGGSWPTDFGGMDDRGGDYGGGDYAGGGDYGGSSYGGGDYGGGGYGGGYSGGGGY